MRPLTPPYFGLVTAATRFDPDQSRSFRTFAAKRITGAVLDYGKKLLRSNRAEQAAAHATGPIAGYGEQLESRDILPKSEHCSLCR